MTENFPPGTRVELTGFSYKGEKGTVIDINKPPVLPKNPFYPAHTYILLDRWVILSKGKNWFAYPFFAIQGGMGAKDIKKVKPPFTDGTPSKFEEEKEDFLSAEKNYVSNNNCPECNIPGEYINGACKCPNCWKVW